MDSDDIIYLLTFLFCIGFGRIYRNIEKVENRKLTGTLIGLCVIILLSGIHVLHIFIFAFINIALIFLFNKRICHLLSFCFSFLYLIFFRTTEYFGIPYPPAHTNLIIMILTLKIVGLAFEINTTHTKKKKDDLTTEQIAENEFRDVNPTLTDMLHYVFNYVGIVAGPYFTYKTFSDSFKNEFYKKTNCDAHTIEKLKYVPLYAGLLFIVSNIYPFSYALSDEFFNDCSWLYRLWYVVPSFFIFRMRIYGGITLSECVCTMAGIGAYPCQCACKPGAGPTQNFVLLKELCEDPEKSKYDYNFETVKNIYPYGADFCITFREAMKHWNMCVQYWLAVNVYKKFPSKQLRTFATMFVSAIWHGVYIGHYFTICGAPFYLPIEDLHVKLFLKDKNGENIKMYEWIIWVFKMFAFSYLGFAFQLLTVERVMHYYNSVYHFGIILGAIMFAIGKVIAKTNKRNRKEKNETN